MLNPCNKCKEEGIKTIKPLTLTKIADRFVKVKVNGIELTLCPYHFDQLLNEISILKIQKIENGKITFVNENVIEW
jgi:hypothetical protein